MKFNWFTKQDAPLDEQAQADREAAITREPERVASAYLPINPVHAVATQEAPPRVPRCAGCGLALKS